MEVFCFVSMWLELFDHLVCILNVGTPLTDDHDKLLPFDETFLKN